ncbi:hypothetical protein EUX98_g3816 [Antrodiella citrinella]|uniref:LIM zinc-binding domain-containing protein n=1 Tax=Antrodiella citrinella TaxID=2447956 RepID=A0A4S4MVJ2_9APHY|nr:hypothetical protein EUX98_g3816 [Antrodiella citrinella]
MRPPPPNAFRQPAQSSPAPYAPPPQPGPAPIGTLSSTSPRPRAVTNAGGPPEFQTGPDVIYSTGNRSPIAAAYDARARAPSNASTNSYPSPDQGSPNVQFSTPSIEIDTKIGGEAGMAGVGRRGFAAAARAAMFTHHTGHSPYLPGPPSSFLNEPPKSPLNPSSPTTPSLPFFEKFKNSINTTLVEDKEEESVPGSPMSDSSYGGLAYADSDAEEDDPPPQPVSAPAATSTFPEEEEAPPEPRAKSATNRVHFPSIDSKTHSIAESSYSSTSPTPSPRLPMRSLSAASTAASAYALRSAAKSTGALDRAMETLFEEDATSPTTTSNSSPAMFPIDGHRDSKPPKLPTRSHTSPTMGAGRPDSRYAVVAGKRREKVPKRVCIKCDKHIEDGRWIQMDGGGVLCDKCWKNMYLPKAISSSDGQLKGKYHRDCFTCHTCQKPFPDKSFYVFDGKPFCGYHYHEANDSLCAATLCGQPIEGPCAVSHAGDKYHPEHFTCEHFRCSEKLVEYWEVEGKMLCEKHANAMAEDDDDDPNVRATRRVTRFIDLAGMGSGPGGGSGKDDDNASDDELR